VASAEVSQWQVSRFAIEAMKELDIDLSNTAQRVEELPPDFLLILIMSSPFVPRKYAQHSRKRKKAALGLPDLPNGKLGSGTA